MRLRTSLPAALAVAGLLLAAVPATGAASTTPMRFGMDDDSLQAQIDKGIAPDYAQTWAGVWNEKYGWGSIWNAADKAADHGAKPVIEWWYWGDSISKSCILYGCWDGLHGAQLSKAKWESNARALADTLHSALQGRPGIVVIESEFNKNGVATWEDFDGMLASHADIFRARAPEVKLVLGFGNWGSSEWWRFDRAVNAMDMVGFQTMRGSTRDSYTSYVGAVDAILSATKKLDATFGKPVLLHDFALSSYPEPTYAGHQESVIKSFFARLGELKAAGLQGVIYRTMRDTNMDTANYYGQAERWWGFEHQDGSDKPALDNWVNGVKAERAGSTSSPEPAPAPAPSTFSATFAPKSTTNNWWVEVKVSSSSSVTKVEAQKDGGSWTSLPKSSWGTWAKSFYVADGAKVKFRATSGSGAQAYSTTYAWS